MEDRKKLAAVFARAFMSQIDCLLDRAERADACALEASSVGQLTARLVKEGFEELPVDLPNMWVHEDRPGELIVQRGSRAFSVMHKHVEQLVTGKLEL